MSSVQRLWRGTAAQPLLTRAIVFGDLEKDGGGSGGCGGVCGGYGGVEVVVVGGGGGGGVGLVGADKLITPARPA
jgi:hypothetical protein